MIRRLAPHTIQQIAAGEVVERPASALKELLENAIDAKATKISVAFDQGGLGQMVVEDNGNGISRDDLELVFEPHATSKIHVIDDLERLRTYGFRGEALAAISSISDVELVTSTTQDDVGWRIRKSFGAPLELKPADRRQGTQITVRQLFVQTPARLKFMKTPRSESMALQNIFKRYVLSFPDVHFELRDLQTNRQQVWPKQSALERVLWYFDSSDRQHWLRLDTSTLAETKRAESQDEWKLSGWILSPHYFGRSRSGICLYFNNRPIRDSKLEFALKRAFEGYSDQMRSLAAAVFVDGPSSEVDVNIHPRKNEIQFKNPDLIASLLVRAVRDILKLEHYSASIETDYRPEPPEALNESVAPTSVLNQSSLSLRPRENERGSSVSAEVKLTDNLRVSFSPTTRFEYLGEIDCTYLVTKLGTKLILFDQHALHERIIYERLLLHYRDKARVESQRLLFPVSVTVADAEYLIENDELLQTLGFELRLWNDQKIQIVAAPSVLKRDYQAVLAKLVESKDLPAETALRDTLATVACHSAVRAHDRLQPEEIQRLLRDFEGHDALGHCPHGRPTFVAYSSQDLEKLFHRIQ